MFMVEMFGGIFQGEMSREGFFWKRKTFQGISWGNVWGELSGMSVCISVCMCHSYGVGHRR